MHILDVTNVERICAVKPTTLIERCSLEINEFGDNFNNLIKLGFIRYIKTNSYLQLYVPRLKNEIGINTKILHQHSPIKLKEFLIRIGPMLAKVKDGEYYGCALDINEMEDYTKLLDLQKQINGLLKNKFLFIDKGIYYFKKDLFS